MKMCATDTVQRRDCRRRSCAHTCLGNERSGGGTAAPICRFDSLVACVRSLGSGGRAYVWVCVAIHWIRFGVFGERVSARKRYLKSGKLPRLFIKI